MYDDLVKRLWECASGECFNCSQYTPTTNASICFKELMKQAAAVIEELSAKVDSLQIFADSISKLPDCNTCLKKGLCEFMPRYGEYCRINCPAWLGVQEPPEEE